MKLLLQQVPRVRALPWLPRCAPLIVYGALALALAGPLLSPGYVLGLDTAFTPRMPLEEQLFGFVDPIYGGTLTQDAAIALFGLALPLEVVQKAYIFLIFFLAGLLMHRLMEGQPEPARYYAGILYVVNPFVYIKVVVGSWALVAAYALAPLAIHAVLKLLESPGPRRAALAALAMTAIAFNIHILMLTTLVGVLLGIARGLAQQKRQVLLWAAAAVALWFALNLYWLLPLLTAERTTLDAISRQDLAIFTSRPADFGTFFTIASLHGYWRPGYLYTKDIFPLWHVVFGAILFLAVYGVVARWRSWRVLGFVTAAAVALVLGTGISGPFAGLSEALFDHVPVMRSMRDSHKYVAVLVLAYAYLGALGVGELWVSLRTVQWRPSAVRGLSVVAILAVPLLYTFGMFGWQGQLKPSPFPDDWHAVNRALEEDPDDVSVLFLPWHQFMDFGWNRNRDKRTASLESFFVKPTVYPENLELPGIYTQSANPGQRYLDTLFGFGAPQPQDVGGALAPLGIRYVVLAKEADYLDYDYLYRQERLELVLEGEHIALFRSTYPVGRGYRVRGPGSPLQVGPLVAVVRESPVEYRVRGEVRDYLLFAPPNLDGRHWRYQGRGPVEGTPERLAVFPGEGEGRIVYTRWRVFLAGYVISGTAAILLLGGLALGRRRAARDVPLLEDPN